MRFIITLILFLFLHNSYSQKKISISYKDLHTVEVLNLIEKKSDYRFYYIKEWFNEELKTGVFKDETIQNILDNVFTNTLINYYISENNTVILTQNSLIRNTPYKDRDTKTKSTDIIEEVKPIFVSVSSTSNSNSIKTVRIGKETQNSSSKKFTLKGKIRNVDTKEPIANAVVLIKELNTNTVTDIDGNYSIRLPSGVNLVETKILGMLDSKTKVILYNNGVLDISLKENSEMLDELVINANANKNIKETVTGITRVEVGQIKNIPLVLGERDILKVAATQPGIKNAGEGSLGYNVRGGKTDQNLFLLDDGVIYNPSHFFGIFSAINPFTTGDVQIYKGHIPAKFGGRASSVFQLKTKNANSEEFSGEASFGPVTSNLSLEIPLKKNKSALLLGGRTTYSNWILKSLDDEALSKSSASFYDFTIKYYNQLNDKNKIEGTAYYSKDSYSIASDSINSYSNALVSLKWSHQFNDKHSASLSLSNSAYEFGIDYENESSSSFNLNYQINESELKFDFNYNLNKKHKFNYGATTKLYIVKPGSIKANGDQSLITNLTIPEEKALESAIYFSDEFTVDDKLALNFGVRFSTFSALGESTQKRYATDSPKGNGTVLETINYKNNQVIKTYGGLEYRASARYFLTKELSIKTSFNNTYQYIHRLSNSTTASPTDTWKLSDLNIKPQRAVQASLGLFKNFNVDQYEISLEGYYKKYSDILDYKVGANLLLNEDLVQDVLQGEGKSYGVEFLLKKNHGRLNGWIGYSYSKSFIKLASEFREEQINNGEYFPSNYDKPHDINIVTNYKLTKRFSLSTNFTYQTGRPVTYPIGKYIFNGAEFLHYSQRNEFRIPDYYRLDIGFNIEGNHKIKKFAHSFWNISIYNVLGKNNPYSVFFVTQDGKVKAYQSSIFSKPIPTITYNFKF